MQGFTKLILVYNGSDIKTFALNADILQKYCFTLPYAQYQTGVFWFAVIRDPSCNQASLSGFYMGELEENNIRNIHLCIDICTYRRELYIGKNLSKIKQSILNRTELDVSSHLSIYIIDNGQTLCENEYIQSLVQSCSSQIHVIPNKNTGGAGGFTCLLYTSIDQVEYEVDYRFAKRRITLRYTPDMKDIFIVETDGSLTPIRLLNKHDNASVKRDKVRLTGGED